MKVTIPRALGAAASAPAAAPTRRSRVAALLAATVVLAIGGQLLGVPTAAASDGLAQNFRDGHRQNFRVGHTVEHMTVPGSAQGESREVDVHLWYPADVRGFSDAPKTVYTSALYGRPLMAGWDPLSWTVPAEVARENAPIDRSGPPFPVIVFSHGSTNDPIDYAHTLELIAGEGFVVAAPYHVNNTQDDVRIDYVNTQAGFPKVPPLLSCNDHRPPPCSRPEVAFSMADRVHDISAVLDQLPGWLGDRVDVSRAGVLGHSRGTVTALAAAGGSVDWILSDPTNPATPNCQSYADAVSSPAPDGSLLCWPLSRDPRVKAVMGLAIGAPKITFGVKLANVTVPTLLVAGGQDQNPPPPEAVSQAAFDQISSEDKAFVSIPNAVHRSFDSTYCDQLQAAGDSADTNHDGRIDGGELSYWMTHAILDRQTLAGIVTASPSGTAMQYCSSASFTTPVDIGPLVKAVAGVDVPCVSFDELSQRCTQYNVPTTGFDTEQVKQEVTELAATFFGTVLKRSGNDGAPSRATSRRNGWRSTSRWSAAPKPSRAADAICPPGQVVVCGD